MRILHLTHTDINSDSRILKEIHSLGKIDNATIVGIGVGLDEEKHKSNIDNDVTIYSINLLSRKWRFLPTIIRHIFSLLELSFKMLSKAISIKPDVIHCHDTMVLPLGVIVKIFTKSKLIYDAHELESNRNGLSKTLGMMTLFAEKMLWRFVDRLIVVSPSIAKWYEQNISLKDTTIILNSPILETSYGVYDKGYLRAKFNIPQNVKIFLYIGILGRGRGIELVLETFKQYKDLDAHLVLLGYGEMRDMLWQVSKEYNNIHIHEAVPHNQVVAIAKSADVGLCLIENVSLSDYYCLPNKLFEYAFADISILASKFPDIVDVIDRYNLGCYCDLDIDSVYGAIKELQSSDINIDSSELYELSWQRQEEKLINLYNGLK